MLPLSSGNTVILKAVSGKIKDSNNLVLQGGGFSTREDAGVFGAHLKLALLFVGAKLRIGIDPGKETVLGGVGKFIKDWAKEEGINLFNDVHGLCTYSEELPVKFASVTAKSSIGIQAQKFVNELLAFRSKKRVLTEKQVLALELYNLSHFETSRRTQFLTLIVSVEALSAREERTQEEIKHLDSLVQQTQEAQLTGAQKNSLTEALKNLKRESISKACRRLVKERLGQKPMELFQECYDIRGKILHSGKSSKGLPLEELDHLISDLLVAEVVTSRKASRQ